MTFTYLGLPMGTTRPRVEHYELVMNRMERQLSSISSMLTHARRLQLVDSILSSSPAYTMCSISIPSTVHDYFERIMIHYLWRSSDITERSKPMVAWKKCTRPKRKGVRESSTSKARTRLSSLNILTSSITRRTSHGLI
jgi:hypothetical protein